MASPPSSSPASAEDLYQRWLRLRLQHGYLSATDGLNRSLALQPCADTASFLRTSGVLLHPEVDGCSLLARPRERAVLANWLRSTGGGPLQWRVVALEGTIWGCTAVPLAARCQQWHLYGDGGSGQTVESGGVFPARLLAVKERQLVLTPAKTARRLRLLDGRGRLLREVPLTAHRPGLPWVVPLDGLPEGWIQPDLGGRRRLDPFLYLPSEPNAVGLVSLWLTNPTAAEFPLDLTWSLPGRQTIWNYLLVPSDPSVALESLIVSGNGCAFHSAAGPETLADGRKAWRLVGDRPLPLLDRGPWRFRLEGRRRDASGRSQRLVIDPLPLAPPEPIWPGNGSDPLVGVSEMVVPL